MPDNLESQTRIETPVPTSVPGTVDPDALGLLMGSGLFKKDGSAQLGGQPPAPAPAPVQAPAPAPVQAPAPTPAPTPVQAPLPGAPVPQLDPAAAMARALAANRAPAPTDATAPAPAPEAAAPEIPETPPPQGDPKGNHMWAGLRARVKTAEAKAAEVEAKVKAYEEEKARIQAEFAEKYKAEQEKAQQLEEQIGRVSLENSPKFREKYATEFGSLVNKTASTLSRYAGVEKEAALEQARQLLTAEPAEIVALTKKLDPSVAGAIVALSADAQALFERRQLELDTWKETQAANAHDEARESMVATVTQRREMADVAINAALEAGVSLYDASNPDLAEQASKITEEFRGFAQSATPDDLMKLAALGHAMPAYLDSLQWYDNRVKELESTLRSRGYAGAIPAGAHTPVPAPQGPVAPEVGQIQDPDQFAKTAMAGIIGNVRAQFTPR